MRPDAQIAYTFFSPSAETFAQSLQADVTDYLPFDTGANASAVLDALRPAAIVFAKLDVWPLLVAEATRRGIPCLLISATVAPRSGRLGTLSRVFLRDAYRELAAVGAIDDAHAARLVRLGVHDDRIHVTGDTRFDQVAERAATVDRNRPPLSQLASARPTLVAGSTWPADDAVLLRAWELMMQSASDIRPRLIIAPHEPVSSHLDPIVAWARKASLQVATIDTARAGTDVVLVDRIGILGQLYALADVAFVGGGFHDAGLHSAIEPAAFGAPVLFGPQNDMSREAQLLLEAGGAFVVRDAAGLADRLRALLFTDPARMQSGERARGVVERECGAVERTVALIEASLPSRSR